MLGAMAGPLLGAQSGSPEAPIYPSSSPCHAAPRLSLQHFAHAALKCPQPQICHYRLLSVPIQPLYECRAGWPEVLFHRGKCHSRKLAEKAQRGLRDAFELFFQELKEALLPNKQAHNLKCCSAGTAGCRLLALCSWTIRQKDERTKRSLTIPLFISTLVGWRLRLIHSG